MASNVLLIEPEVPTKTKGKNHKNFLLEMIR